MVNISSATNLNPSSYQPPIPEAQDLQDVTDLGATTTNGITISPSGNDVALTLNGSGTGDALNIDHSGSGVSLNIENGGSGDFFRVDTSKFVIKNDGKQGNGTGSPAVQSHISDGVSLGGTFTSALTTTKHLISESEGIAASTIISTGNTNTNRGVFYLQRSRGTTTTPTALQADDYVGDFLFGGHDGTNIQNAAGLFAFVDGSVSSGRVPMRLSFVTGASLATRAERLTVKNDGKIGVNTILPNAQLEITSSGSNVPLVLRKTAETGVRERLFTATVSDDANASFFINNGTIGNGSFAPVFGGYTQSTTLWPLGFGGYVNSTADASDSSTYGLLDFACFRTTNASDPLNGTLSDIVNRKILTVRTLSTIHMTILANGNTGYGVTPDTRLDVNGAITQRELSTDPSDPDEGSFVTWMSDGTGTGDDGDIIMKITAGGVTKTVTIVDFSTLT